MLKAPQILVRTLALAASAAVIAAAIAGCGQRGPLYLPTDAAAAQRATLPETLTPSNNSSISTPGNSSAGTANTPSAPAAAASTPR